MNQHSSITSATLAVAISLALVTPVFALDNEPSGFHEATFGASTDELKKRHPDVAAVEAKAPGVPVTALRLEKQTALGVDNCSVEFHLVSDELYEVSVDCGREADTLTSLKRSFGEPTQTAPTGAFWFGEKTNIAYDSETRIYALSDRARRENLNQMVIQAIVANARKNAGKKAAKKNAAPPAGGGSTPEPGTAGSAP